MIDIDDEVGDVGITSGEVQAHGINVRGNKHDDQGELM